MAVIRKPFIAMAGHSHLGGDKYVTGISIIDGISNFNIEEGPSFLGGLCHGFELLLLK